MSEDTQTLDEVVVVGFGTQRKANLTEAVATVDTKVLDSRPVTNLGQSLQGTIPGLNLSVGGLGGQLGQTMDVNIRGTGTISTGSKAATLVLIDGIEGNMNNLNPDDVESISVLKDAAASSIYGSRAAFGVILITTKKGKAGKASVSYSGNARYAIKMRVWERGSGETLSCGTGACAAAVAAMLSGCVSEGETAVELRGGRLFVTWDRTKNKVLLTGPAETVFEGTLAERI